MLYQNSSVTGVASLITPRLYLTDYVTAMNSKKLEELGITHIISVIEHKPNLPDFIPEIQRHHLPLSDLPEAQILHHLDTTTAFIRRALEENETNKVLVSINRFGSSLTHWLINWQVHCRLGISRSATVVCAYLIATSKLTVEESIERVQSLRRVVSPNFGFRQQLGEYARRYAEDEPNPHQMSMPDILISGGDVYMDCSW